jgi:hypothetical protein
MVHEGEMRLSEAELSDRISSGTSLAVFIVHESFPARITPAQVEMGARRSTNVMLVPRPSCVGGRRRNDGSGDDGGGYVR